MKYAAPLVWPLILASEALPPALLHGPEGAEAGRLKGYANLFPLAYFKAYAPHLVLTPTIWGKGLVKVSTILQAPDGTEQIVRSETADLPTGGVWVGGRIALSDLPTTGALFLSFRSETTGRVTGAAWSAATAPRRDVRLSIGITTFNRPKDVARTVDLLAARRDDGIAEVYVVDQGETHADFPELPGFLHVARQRNLGGAGGFARALSVAAAAKRATHHIFMDDDAFPQEENFARLRFFLGHAETDHAVGGQMLALEDPLQMTEFGVRLSPAGEREDVGRGVRVDGPEVAALTHQLQEIDAHAWWFWAVPLAAARKAGAPLPLFIKFDDIEYTDRLRRIGCATVPLPGLFVRHPAIHMKAADWRYYYFARNSAIAASAFGRDGIGRDYGLNTLIGSLLRHEYRRTALEIMALNDYLAGPEELARRDEEAIHGGVRAAAGRLRGPETIALTLANRAEAPPTSPGAGSDARRYVAALLRSWRPADRRAPFVWADAAPVDPMAASLRDYLRPMATPGTFERYAFERGRYLGLLLRSLWCAARFALGARRASRRWSENAAQLTAPEAWKSRFETAKPAPKGRG